MGFPLIPGVAGTAAGVAGSLVTGQLTPWVVKDPPDPAKGLDPGNPWAGYVPGEQHDDTPNWTREANRSWDPGALEDQLGVGARTPWDYLVLAGFRTPGIATIRATKRARLDKKETAGTDGQTVTHLGMRCSEVTVRLRLLTQGDLDAWAAIVPAIQPRPGKTRPDPVSVSHPALDIMGVKSLYVEELGVPEVPVPGGPVEVTIRFVEFLPPKKTGTSTPKRSRVNVEDKPRVNGAARPGTPAPPAKPSQTPGNTGP